MFGKMEFPEYVCCLESCSLSTEGREYWMANLQCCHLAGKSETVYPFSFRKKQLLTAKGRPSTWVAL